MMAAMIFTFLELQAWRNLLAEIDICQFGPSILSRSFSTPILKESSRKSSIMSLSFRNRVPLSIAGTGVISDLVSP